jgi:hypothetical protein
MPLLHATRHVAVEALIFNLCVPFQVVSTSSVEPAVVPDSSGSATGVSDPHPVFNKESDQGDLEGGSQRVSLPPAVYSGSEYANVRLCLRPGAGDLAVQVIPTRGSWCRPHGSLLVVIM